LLQLKLLTDKPNSLKEISKEQKIAIRKHISYATKQIEKFDKKNPKILKQDNQHKLKQSNAQLASYTSYAPYWTILLISISLGLGTTIGWKRIVVTIGEKIGKEHLTYAQGASSELIATGMIAASTQFGLPVSTTHVLSSGIAGSMVASKGLSNLQGGTIKNIALAWILTLPVCIVCAMAIFGLMSLFF
jgi:PiT family inorganic phosphate transporter